MVTSLTTGTISELIANIVGVCIIAFAAMILLKRVLSWLGIKVGREQAAPASASGCDSCKGCGRGSCP